MNISQTYQEKLSSGASKTYKVPAGVVTFKELSLATQDKPGSSFKAALYWDADGKGKTLTKIAQIYTRNKSYRVDLKDVQFISNGKSEVLLRRHIFGANGPRETYVRWEGILNA